MSKPTPIAVIALAFALPNAVAAAGSQPVVYLSTAGANGAGCGSQQAPCRTLQHALDNAVGRAGTIYLATPGNFGPATIRFSVTIANRNAASAGVTNFAEGSTALRVSAGAAGQVVLDGVTVDGGGAGANGVIVGSAASVLLRNCSIRNFDPASGAALRVSAATPTVLTLQDTTISDPGRYGVYLNNVGVGTLTASLIRTRIFDGATGVAISQTSNATKLSFADSVLMGNGVAIENGANGEIVVENSRLTANDTALANSGLASLAGSTIAVNQTGVLNRAGAQTNTWRSSVIIGNRSDITGAALTPATLK